MHEVVDQVSSEVRMELGLKKYEVLTIKSFVWYILQEARREGGCNSL